MILFSDYLCNLTFQKLYFLLLLLRNPFLLNGSLNERSISAINKDPKNNFNSEMKQITKCTFSYFNNQTEAIAVITNKFVTYNQAYHRKVWEL